jgi:hypothetical protein
MLNYFRFWFLGHEQILIVQLQAGILIGHVIWHISFTFYYFNKGITKQSNEI